MVEQPSRREKAAKSPEEAEPVEEFLEYVIRQLIEFPEEMVLTKVENPRKVVFTLRLRQSDVGKVIGKHGQTINAIRNLLSASASRQGQRALLQIDEDEVEERRPARE